MKKERLQNGFTLIETALALLAIGLGLMGLLALGRSGLQTTKEMETERRCQQFADAVFETLRDQNQRIIETVRTNAVTAVSSESEADTGGRRTWSGLWGLVCETEKAIPFPWVLDADGQNSLYLVINPPGQLPTETFDRDKLSLNAWYPRYRLYISPVSGSYVAEDEVVQVVMLVVYPDGYTYSTPYRVYQTTLTNTGGLL